MRPPLKYYCPNNILRRFNFMLDKYEKQLRQTNLAENTIVSYRHSLKQYIDMYDGVFTKRNLLSFKGFLIEKYAINKYLEFNKLEKLKLKMIKVQQKTYLENVISDADYKFFKNKLKKDGRMNWYFIVRYLAATGARISELVQIKIEHVHKGYIDIYGKGGKVRRIYIPKALKNETLKWLENTNLDSGYLFLNRFGEKITTRGVAHQLKIFAAEYGMDTKVIYPHSFRHRFAKNFLEKYNDLAFLADLMGHESIETTRIYLRKTANEQQAIVDKVVTW